MISDDGDIEQIQRIRSHLKQEADQFGRGHFHDPQQIHGEDMAGVHALVQGHDRIAISYSDIEMGGEILYTTEDAEIVSAIHAWFDAQLSDHGAHARGHP